MRRKITREIFVEIETVRVTKKRSAQKKTNAPETRANVSVEIYDCADSFMRNAAHPEEIVNKLF